MAATHQAGDDVTEHRRLTLSIPRVDVRLVQRTRTSADNTLKPAHFQYIVRCDWSGNRREDIDFGSAEDLDAQQAGELYWWDTLPNSYVLRHQWADIRKLHNLVANELAFDQKAGYWRVKTRMPELPAPGNLDKFIVTLAASGDVMALNRRDGLQPKDSQPDFEKRALEDLDFFHTIYVENRLAPYIAELNKILAELPLDILRGSQSLRKFCTNGAACRVRPPDQIFFGPAPHFDPSQLDARVNIARKSGQSLRKSKKPPAPQPVVAKPPQAAVQEAPSGLSRAESSPELASHDADLDHPSFSEEDAARRRRLESSHYGFFAKALSNKDLAHSNRDYWKRMVAKERRELGRRTLLMPLEDSGMPPMLSRSASAAAGRLPMLPPPRPWEMKPGMHRSGSGLQDTAPSLKESLNLSLKSRPEELAQDKEVGQKDVITRDLCEGLRISLLGEQFSQVPRSIRLLQPMPVRPLPNEAETKKVYRLYCDLLAEEGLTPAAGDEIGSPPLSSEQQHRPTRAFARAVSTDKDYGKHRRAALVCKELTRISWKSILNWVQHMEDLAEDFRKRSVIAALNRALQNWRKKLASPRQRRNGVSLAMLISWIWPNVTEQHMTQMMEWICMFELDKFRQPTPPLMDAQDRKVLESIFHTMDRHGKGSVLPEDIAGGKDQVVADKLKNIVDADTVKAVIGEDRVTLLPFLELMCENGYRAHEGAKEVWVCEDSSNREGKIGEVRKKIVQQNRKAIGKKIWVVEGNPPEEEQARRLADVFEAEVLRWRTMAEAAAMKSGEHEDLTNEWEEDSDELEGDEDDGQEEDEELSAMVDGGPAQTLA
eukprot:TRINITY_DN11644_c0_g1_i1.p1 TRINITY_DN11644_c0_g1~~TRINITY_DN11644_c0_g1_i1.p1  ORF type:complete len:827 (+),score=135.04 TRINITY_DN11644_c0_g1_i1:87-2567(+)